MYLCACSGVSAKKAQWPPGTHSCRLWIMSGAADAPYRATSSRCAIVGGIISSCSAKMAKTSALMAAALRTLSMRSCSPMREEDDPVLKSMRSSTKATSRSTHGRSQRTSVWQRRGARGRTICS